MIRNKKDVMMISLQLKNGNTFRQIYGVSLEIIRRIQSGYKTCEYKLRLKTGEDIGRRFEKDTSKSPAPDLAQEFWLKNFSSLHEEERLQLKECLDSRFVPSWLTRGRTSLLQKDKSKGNVANNSRPKTCLSFIWKLLTGVIADQIYA